MIHHRQEFITGQNTLVCRRQVAAEPAIQRTKMTTHRSLHATTNIPPEEASQQLARKHKAISLQKDYLAIGIRGQYTSSGAAK